MGIRRLATRWDKLDQTAIQRLQLRLLRRFLRRQVLPFSAQYRAVFGELRLDSESIRSLEDFRKIPFTEKRDLLNTSEHPERTKDFLLAPDRARLARRPSTLLRALTRGPRAAKASLEYEYRPVFLTATTGRSSDPVTFLYTRHDLDNLAIAGHRLVEVFQTERDYRVMNLFPFAPHLAFWQVHYGAIAFGLFNLSTGGGKVMGTQRNIRLIEKIAPQALIGMPTFLYHVLQQMLEEGLRCTGLRRIILGGEKAPAGMRRKLRAMAGELGSPGVDVLATYGFTEAKMAFGECPFPHDGEPSGYHLYPDLALVEIVDPKSGEPLPPGTPGEIVFTPLDARGSVVLRYRTGDIIDGGLHCEPCPNCGRSVPRLVGRISRQSEFREMRFDKVKGTLINFNDLENVLEELTGVGTWQVELRKANDDPLDVDEIHLHISRSGRSGDEDRVRRDIRREFEERLELRPNRVIFHSSSEMRRLQGVGKQLKEEKVVDHRPKSSAAQKAEPTTKEASE